MLNRWQRTIVDLEGNVVPYAQLQIRVESTQAAAIIYADRLGTAPLPSGIVTADENGYAFFYAEADLYRISSAEPTIDWRYVDIGAAGALQRGNDLSDVTNPATARGNLGLDTVVEWVSGDKIITVADSGADFTTVMGAVAEAMKWRSIDGSVIVEIQSSYLVQEQLFFIDNDYSHINIKAQNSATITVDHNSMSVTDFEGLGFSGFIVCARGKSPMFQAQFEFLTRPADTIAGAMAAFNGEVYFGNNSGVKGAGRDGILSYGGGSVNIGNSNDFSGAGQHGVIGTRGGSIIMGDGNDFSGAGANGADSYGGGSVNIGNSNDFSGAGRYGASSSNGGTIIMGTQNDFSGVSVGNHSFRVATNGFIRAGGGTIFTEGRERSQAAGTITASGLIMG